MRVRNNALAFWCLVATTACSNGGDAVIPDGSAIVTPEIDATLGATDGSGGSGGVRSQKDAAVGSGGSPVGSDGPAPVGNKLLGATCGSNSECANSQCVDNVCCGVAVCGTCSVCAAKTGACQPVEKGSSDPGTCETGRACDGMGACKQAAGIECVDDAQCATGACTDGYCCNQPCKDSCQTCGGTTKGTCQPLLSGPDNNATSRCIGDYACYENPSQAGQSVCRKPDGKTCGNPDQCISAVCSAFSIDDDRDSFGSDSKTKRMLCGAMPPAGLAARGGDCNDGEANVRPNQTAFFKAPIPGGQGYDYNCDKREEQEQPATTYWRTNGFDRTNDVPGCGIFLFRLWEASSCSRYDCAEKCTFPTDRCVFPCPNCQQFSGCNAENCNHLCNCDFFPVNEPVAQGCR